MSCRSLGLSEPPQPCKATLVTLPTDWVKTTETGQREARQTLSQSPELPRVGLCEHPSSTSDTAFQSCSKIL